MLTFFKPYYTFVIFLIPIIALLLIPVFEILIKKAGALAGLVFSLFYIFILPMGLAESNAMTIIFPATFILGAFLLSAFQREFPQFGSIFYSFLGFILVYIFLTIAAYLMR